MSDEASYIPEEKELVRKLDWRIVPFVSFLYFLSFLDRSNLSNVHYVVMHHIGISETAFSTAISVFYIGYIIFEIPSNLMLKRVSPSLWIGLLVLGWGICSTCMVFVNSYSTLLIIRIFLGIAESGFFPGIVFWMTFWYRQRERALRVALFYCSSSLAGAVGGLLSYGILQGSYAIEPWQVLFLMEGIPSIVFGVATWFILPTHPQDATWLTAQERMIAVSRLGSSHGNGGHGFHDVWRTLISPKMICFAILYLGIVSPLYSIALYLPTIISEFGFSPIFSNLLSTPVHILGVIAIISNSFHSDKTGERPWHVIIPALIASFGFFVVGISTLVNLPGLSFAAMFIASPSSTCLIPVVLAWLTNSTKSSTASGTATGMVIGFGNLGGIIGPSVYGWLYIPPSPEDPSSKGSFVWAHFVMAASLLVTVVAALVLILFQRHEAEVAARSATSDLQAMIPKEDDIALTEIKANNDNSSAVVLTKQQEPKDFQAMEVHVQERIDQLEQKIDTQLGEMRSTMQSVLSLLQKISNSDSSSSNNNPFDS